MVLKRFLLTHSLLGSYETKGPTSMYCGPKGAEEKALWPYGAKIACVIGPFVGALSHPDPL